MINNIFNLQLEITLVISLYMFLHVAVGINQLNGLGDLFIRIIALFKTSPHQIGGCYLNNPRVNCVVVVDTERDDLVYDFIVKNISYNRYI